jgi:hypothetical protein
VEGKGDPAEVYFIFFLQLFNTPGNEIAPGSGVIGENFQKGFGHRVNLIRKCRLKVYGLRLKAGFQ